VHNGCIGATDTAKKSDYPYKVCTCQNSSAANDLRTCLLESSHSSVTDSNKGLRSTSNTQPVSVTVKPAGKEVNLAEQKFVDCDTSGQSGCGGGSTTFGLQWLESHAACTTASYPYKAGNGNCHSCTSAGVSVGGVNIIESALKSALGGLVRQAKTLIYDMGVKMMKNDIQPEGKKEQMQADGRMWLC